MTPDLTNAIVNITSAAPDTVGFGTGFVIYRDQAGDYVLTCKHVVNAVGKETILADGIAAQEIASGSETGFDLAILRIEKSLPRQPLVLRMAQTPCGQFVTRGHYSLSSDTITEGGYTKKADIRLSETLIGQLDAASRTELREADGCSVSAWWLDLPPNAKHLLQPGYSGAPLIETTSGAVVGVISIRFDGGGRGLAISTQAIRLIWPNHPANLFAESAAQWPEPIINLDAERAAFDDIVSGKDRQTRLILVHGAYEGMGKSYLIRIYKHIAESHQRRPFFLKVNAQISVEECLKKIVLHFGGISQFKNYERVRLDLLKSDLSAEQKWDMLTEYLFLDFEQSHASSQIVLLFDEYNPDKPEASFKHWLTQTVLSYVAYQQNMVVVIAGREKVVPPESLHISHHAFSLSGVTIEQFEKFLKTYDYTLQPREMDIAFKVSQGRPFFLASFVQSEMKRQQEARHAG
ncbi:GUN4-like protein [Candidatus Moduliflexus flocculans]|uniref:GUN4-like protein n=1 Tax=Candidatus Moduliflexus flocculans TaxID=1499966 RepID=A0A081BT21_9BACT|nr:GUN4-like protein [Candidatus Moduliflexus flocculans]